MAKWHYDLTGAEPIIRDVQMYDAADINTGEFLMQGATAPVKSQFITGYVDSSACMVNGLGIAMETINTSGSVAGLTNGTTTNMIAPKDPIDTAASIATQVATGARYGKAIINPFAVYLTEYSQITADVTTLVGAGAAAATTVTITSMEDDIDGGWYYQTYLGSTPATQGMLRYIATAAAGSFTTLTAVTSTTADKYIKILPINHELIDIDTTSKFITTDDAASSCVTLKNIQNYIAPNGNAIEVLRPKLHDVSTAWNNLTKFYSDLVMLDHCYNTVATG